MRTKNYKTLKGLNAQTTQLTFQEILNGRFYHINSHWVPFKVEEKENAINQVVSSIGGRYSHKIKSVLTYQKPQHWALGRFIYSKRSDQFQYCAGQDMTWEMNELRKYLYARY